MKTVTTVIFHYRSKGRVYSQILLQIKSSQSHSRAREGAHENYNGGSLFSLSGRERPP